MNSFDSMFNNITGQKKKSNKIDNMLSNILQKNKTSSNINSPLGQLNNTKIFSNFGMRPQNTFGMRPQNTFLRNDRQSLNKRTINRYNLSDEEIKNMTPIEKTEYFSERYVNSDKVDDIDIDLNTASKTALKKRQRLINKWGESLNSDREYTDLGEAQEQAKDYFNSNPNANVDEYKKYIKNLSTEDTRNTSGTAEYAIKTLNSPVAQKLSYENNPEFFNDLYIISKRNSDEDKYLNELKKHRPDVYRHFKKR